MRVLVTGGGGYVGCHAIRELADAGHDVIVYDNFCTGNRKLCDGFEIVEGDVADIDTLAPILGRVEAVMHFAAAAYVGESVMNPRKYFRHNVESALALMDAVLASKVRKVIFSSSCATYGVPNVLPITENLPMEPINPYGATKLFFEHVLSAYSVSHGLGYAALRYFNAAGAHSSGLVGEIHDPETHLIPLALKAVSRTAPPLKIFGNDLDTPDGTCVRDFVHVSDLGVAHVLALEYLADGGESISLNLGTGKGTSIKELIHAISRLTGLDVPHEFGPARVGDPPSLYADPSKAKEILGWAAKRDMDEILTSAWKWQQKLDAMNYGLLIDQSQGPSSPS
jgi:UDP-glucose-4-epimerase GalE